ncbi:cAMP-binding proteins - catabolite gene activator and regulatory subunit of cAMP-dependent protein kinases [Tenacibaculum sp. 190130A14a]|uniref:Cyclic nucleotide-binding domain-containing protein n=1 Tax=Tenacibaculum polynesiense TaxID=3137857 RepID=A0ABM9PFD2_9FLAO
MDFLKNFVYNFHQVSNPSLKEFEHIVTEKSFKKGHTLVKIGEISKNFYILKEGIIRSFLVDDKGKEHTRTLYTPPSTSGNLSSLISKKPSILIYECLTDCNVLECNYEQFYQLSSKYHDLAIFQYKALEFIYIREESRILELSMLNATERYQLLLKTSPGIDQKINQYHIASYLNITPVQLSRVKKGLLKN